MATTTQKIIIGNSSKLDQISDKSINLIITSPPYPMIKMWDGVFGKLNNSINSKLIEENPNKAFKLMHKELNKVYKEGITKLKDDGIICINIADSVRSFKNKFYMFSNVSETIKFFTSNGFDLLPSIIWNKPTNSPNKFMGSGMLPVGAYNTLETEHILIFRKNKRNFKSAIDKNIRNKSAFFWNERNVWCQNIWKFVGTKQKNLNDSRERSGSFPLELPYRIISMWTVENDTVLDIFGGAGTTLLACTALKRNGIMVEIEKDYKKTTIQRITDSIPTLNLRNQNRIIDYKKFNLDFENLKNKKFKYFNSALDIKVMTKQETQILIPKIKKIINSTDNELLVEYD